MSDFLRPGGFVPSTSQPPLAQRIRVHELQARRRKRPGRLARTTTAPIPATAAAG